MCVSVNVWWTVHMTITYLLPVHKKMLEAFYIHLQEQFKHTYTLTHRERIDFSGISIFHRLYYHSTIHICVVWQVKRQSTNKVWKFRMFYVQLIAFRDDVRWNRLGSANGHTMCTTLDCFPGQRFVQLIHSAVKLTCCTWTARIVSQWTHHFSSH